ncbi:MAG: hypothetical protein RQ826_09420 [Xanthomonadales bacterium]|nr:hypothetical protein [Xanthomonadales bacterium]
MTAEQQPEDQNASSSQDTGRPNGETTVQSILKQMILIGFVAFFIAYFGYLLYEILTGGWILTKIQQNFAATVVMAFAALVALFVVLLLQYSAGQIEFEVPGFKFRGASGPVVLWVLSFLAVTAAIAASMLRPGNGFRAPASWRAAAR